MVIANSIHANQYDFGVIFKLFYSNYTITIVIVILCFLLYNVYVIGYKLVNLLILFIHFVNALLASQYRIVIIYISSAVTAALDLFFLNNVMRVKHRHIVLSLEKENYWYF